MGSSLEAFINIVGNRDCGALDLVSQRVATFESRNLGRSINGGGQIDAGLAHR
jgi:hypothetical protein